MRPYLVPREETLADIEQTELIRATIVEVFRALTESRIIDEWGGGPARVQAKPNGKYSLWDGEMYGVVREVEYPVRLVYTLREEHWDDTVFDSLVTWNLREVDRGTLLSLRHSGLPNRKTRDIHDEGWSEYFFGPLKAYLEQRKK